MDYFLMKQPGTISIPKESKPQAAECKEPSVRMIRDLSALKKTDYIAEETLISSRLKPVLERYLPEQAWRPCVFVDIDKKEEEVFWFLPPLTYQPEQVRFASNGLPAAVYIQAQDFAGRSPGIFRIRGAKGTLFTVIHLSIAESILRRGICGVELIRLMVRCTNTANNLA